MIEIQNCRKFNNEKYKKSITENKAIETA